VAVGAFIEEAISPIPSFMVLLPAGAAAQVQGVGWWYLPVLAVIASAGRIVASALLYLLADKAEDVLFGHGRKFFGISHRQLQEFGKRLSGQRRDWWALFALNAVPVLPTSFLSLACGFIKVRFKLFVTATFVGAAINAFIYLAIGYAGLRAAAELQGVDAALQIITGLVLAALIVWFIVYQKRRRKKTKLLQK
jgi:membrane protein DedA with SNARE-associated domain